MIWNSFRLLTIQFLDVFLHVKTHTAAFVKVQQAPVACSLQLRHLLQPARGRTVAVRCRVSRCCQTRHTSAPSPQQLIFNFESASALRFRTAQIYIFVFYVVRTHSWVDFRRVKPIRWPWCVVFWNCIRTTWNCFEAIVSVRSMECRVSKCVKDRLISFKRNSHYPSLAGMHENPRKKSQSVELSCKCSIAYIDFPGKAVHWLLWSPCRCSISPRSYHDQVYIHSTSFYILDHSVKRMRATLADTLGALNWSLKVVLFSRFNCLTQQASFHSSDIDWHVN